MYCKECKKDVQDDLRFCPDCGSMLEATSSLEELGNTSVEENFSEPIHIEVPIQEQKKSKKGLRTALIAIVVVLAITAVGVFGRELLVKNAKLVEAYTNTYLDSKQSVITTTLSMKDINIPLLGQDELTMNLITKLVEDVQMKGTVKQDKEANKYEVDAKVAIRNSDLLTLNLYLDTEGMGIKIPELYKKQFYFNWSDIANMIEDNTGIQVTFEEYIKMLTRFQDEANKTINRAPYIKVLEDFVDAEAKVSKNQKTQMDGKDVKGDRYSFTLAPEDMNNLMVQIMKIALEDESILSFIDKVINDVVDTLVATGDAASMGLDAYDLEEIRNSVNEIKSELAFIDASMLDELLAVEDFEEAQVRYDHDFYVSGNYIKGMSTNMSITTLDPMTYEPVSLSINVKTYVESVNKSIKFTGIDKANGINITNLTEEELENIGYEMQGNLMMLFLFNPVLSQLTGELF